MEAGALTLREANVIIKARDHNDHNQMRRIGWLAYSIRRALGVKNETLSKLVPPLPGQSKEYDKEVLLERKAEVDAVNEARWRKHDRQKSNSKIPG